MTTQQEQHTDLAGRIIPIIDREFDDFETEATEFLKGNREERLFIGFRLKQGVYGQRQPARQMIRIKLPLGMVTSDQLDVLGDVIEEYAPLRKGHITTRENVQIHHIPLHRMTGVLRAIGAVGLSSREGCGNTVRNVTGDPWAGIRADEPFDPTPYAGAYVRYWVRNPLTQLLPRKWKTSFSAADDDVAMSLMHDLGFIAKVQDVDGEPVRGFKMVVGGGLSTMPKDAITIREFVSVDEFLKVSEAVLRVFNDASELRKNINKARIKFLVHRVGPEEFNRMVEARLQEPWAQDGDFRPDRLLFLDDEESDAPALPATPLPVAAEDRFEFEAWKRANTRPQRQAGYVAAEVKVPQGDLTPEQFRGLGAVIRAYGNGRARTTPWQNLVIRWVPEGYLYGVWRDLRALGLAGAGALSLRDVVSCPGTDSCKLGITSSMGLNRAVSERIEAMGINDPLTEQVLVNISGCPNSCGQHHIANIGFHGAAMKSGERQAPAYHVFVGGERHNGRDLRHGTLIKARIPAKRVPVAVERYLRMYEAQRQPGEAFNEYFDRVGAGPFEAAVQDLALPPEFAVTAFEEFIDWEREGLYVLERGEGECAV